MGTFHSSLLGRSSNLVTFLTAPPDEEDEDFLFAVDNAEGPGCGRENSDGVDCERKTGRKKTVSLS